MITVFHNSDMSTFAAELNHRLEMSGFNATTDLYNPAGHENFVVTSDVTLSEEDNDRVLDIVDETFRELGMSYDVL